MSILPFQFDRDDDMTDAEYESETEDALLELRAEDNEEIMNMLSRYNKPITALERLILQQRRDQAEEEMSYFIPEPTFEEEENGELDDWDPDD